MIVNDNINNLEKNLEELDKKKELQKKVFVLLQSSRMSFDEKKMWIAMLPYMEEKHVEKLADILEREVGEFTNLYINALNSSVSESTNTSKN